MPYPALGNRHQQAEIGSGGLWWGLWFEVKVGKTKEAIPVEVFDRVPTFPEMVSHLACYQRFTDRRRGFRGQERLFPKETVYLAGMICGEVFASWICPGVF